MPAFLQASTADVLSAYGLKARYVTCDVITYYGKWLECSLVVLNLCMMQSVAVKLNENLLLLVLCVLGRR